MQNYTSWVTNLANAMVIASTETNFQSFLNQIIDDAEQRCYRDLDLLNTIVRDSSAALTAGTRTFSLPSQNGTFVVVESISVITPVGVTDPNSASATLNPLLPMWREALTYFYPSVNGSSVPQFFGMLTQTSVIVAPWPDQAYQVQVTGTVRPTPLNGTSVGTTLLTWFFPDLFFSASMVAAVAYQQNFGASGADNPQMGVNWEAHYQAQLRSAEVEEARKKFTSQGWSSKTPSQTATPPRT